jgi:hypothetical protein
MHAFLLAAALAAGAAPAADDITNSEFQQLLESPTPADAGRERPRLAMARRQKEASSLPEQARPERTAREEQVFSSVLICYADGKLVAANLAIRREKAVAGQKGVANLTRLSEEKGKASNAQRLKHEALARLHERKLAPLSCSQAEVAHLSGCMKGMSSVSSRDWCEDAAWRDFNQQRELFALVDLD